MDICRGTEGGQGTMVESGVERVTFSQNLVRLAPRAMLDMIRGSERS